MPERPVDGPDQTVDEIMQADRHHPAVLVKVEGPTLVQELPARAGSIADVQVDNTRMTLIIGGPGDDPKRKAITIVCASALQLGTAKGSRGAYWPANVPLRWASALPLYAMTSVGTALVTVLSEHWAD